MRRKNNITMKPKHILIICSVACLVMILFTFLFPEKSEPVKNVFGTVVSPMQRGIDSAGDWIKGKRDMFQSTSKLKKENKELQKRVDVLSGQNKILQLDQYELNSLRELFKLDKTYSEYPKVAARVISEPTDNWFEKFKIDKGTDDGLKVGMNVMAGDGLVGIITYSGHNYSWVRSIIDDVSSVSGMALKSKDYCIISGNLELRSRGFLEIGNLKADAKVKEGYEIVTSSISDKYLPGILIGIVKSVAVDPSELTKSGYLEPAVDFNKLDTVLVITTLKEKQY